MSSEKDILDEIWRKVLTADSMDGLDMERGVDDKTLDALYEGRLEKIKSEAQQRLNISPQQAEDLIYILGGYAIAFNNQDPKNDIKVFGERTFNDLHKEEIEEVDPNIQSLRDSEISPEVIQYILDLRSRGLSS